MILKKIAIVVLILFFAQVISGIICWLLYKELLVVPTLLGSLFPALMYINQSKNKTT